MLADGKTHSMTSARRANFELRVPVREVRNSPSRWREPLPNAVYFGCRGRSAGVPPATDCGKLAGGTPAIRAGFGTFGAKVDGIGREPPVSLEIQAIEA